LEPASILNTTARQLASALLVDGCAISYWDRERDVLVLQTDYTVDRDHEHTAEPGTVYHLADMPAARTVLHSRVPLVVQASNPDADPAEVRWMMESKTSSLLAVPLVVRDKVTGLLTLTQSEERAEREFTPTDVALCQTLTNQAAAVLENARLFKQAQQEIAERRIAETQREQLLTDLERRNTQLQTAAEISRAAGSILEPGRLTQQAVDLVREGFDLYYAGLFLLDETRQWAILRAATGKAGRIQLENGHKLQVDSDSMIGWCVTNGQARISLDVGAEGTRFVNPLLPKTRSEIALPLSSRGQVIGAMTIQSSQEEAFSQDDISALQTMADQLANAIQNASLFKERSRHSEELTTLNYISSTVNQSLEMQELLDTVLEAVIAVMGFDAGLFSLADETTGQLYLAAFQALPDSMVRQFEQNGLAGTLCQVVHEAGETLGLGDLREGAPVDVDGLIRNGLLAYVGIPLVHQERRLGTLCIFGRSAHDLDIAQLSILEAIGHQIGVGIQNARLFNQVQAALSGAEEQTEHLSLLNEMSWELSQAEGIDEILANAAYQTARILSAEQVTVSSIDAKTGSYAVLALHGEKGIVALGECQPLAGSPIEVVFQEKRLVNIAEAETAVLDGFRSYLFAPLYTAGQVSGTINLANRDPNAYDPRHENLMLQIASLLSAALEKRHLFEQTEASADELSMLFDVSQELASALLRPEEIAEIVVRQLFGFGDMECSISLLSSDGNALRVSADLFIEDGTVRREEADAEFQLSEYPTTARAMETLRPLVVQAGDPEGDPAELAYMRQLEVETLVIFPLSVKGEAIGVMELKSWEKRHYTPKQLNLITTLANQAAAALDNARLFEQAQGHAQRERRLRQIVTAINASEDLLSDLDAIADLVCEFTPANAVALVRYTPGDAEFTYYGTRKGTQGPLSFQQRVRMPIRSSRPGWVITHEQPWIGNDLRKNQRFAEEKRMVDEGTGSRAILPLRIGDRILGALDLGSPEPNAFSEEDVTFIGQVADQLALALERMRLLEETQAALAKVQATHQRYLREQWEGALASGPHHVWGYIEGPDGLRATEKVWTPEIEQALATGELTTVELPATKDGQSNHSGLAVPIRLLGQTIGILDFSAEERIWTEDDKALVTALADQIAVALENQRLFEQTQRRAQREHLAGEIVGKIRAAGDVRDILETAVEELGRALGVSRTRVHLGDPNNGQQFSHDNRRKPIQSSTGVTDAGTHTEDMETHR
jgi:GAF domain-containing protein